MKVIKKTAIILLIALVVIQFFRPSKNTSLGNHTKVFSLETNPSKEVDVLLRQSCYDCHSDNTNYPWYVNVAPFSFWMSDHIKEGKKHLNFSNWESYTVLKKAHKLKEIVEKIEDEQMPLREYVWTHKEANLSIEQKKMILDWAKRSRALYLLKNQPQ